tara:strand:- start:4178 stop:4402 length:225 start_codon:yes stop_codon:yes gene_type:complete
MKINDLNFEIVSSGDKRDGLGIEVWLDEKLIIEIFRNDIKKIKEVSTYLNDIPLEVIEFSIEYFKKEIPENYMD